MFTAITVHPFSCSDILTVRGHFYFYLWCSLVWGIKIVGSRVINNKQNKRRTRLGCVWLNLLWFFTPLEPFQCYPNLIGRAYISIFSIILPCNKKLFSLRLWFYASTYVRRSFSRASTGNCILFSNIFPIRVVLVSMSYLILRRIFVKVKAFFNYFYGFRPVFYLHGREYRLIPLILCYFSIIFGIYYSFSRLVTVIHSIFWRV